MAIKRYFVTKTLESTLPYEFVYAKGKRHISLVSCDFVEKIEEGDEVIVRVPMHISLHSNIVQVDRYCDCFVDFVNRVRDKRKKYEQFDQEETVKFWYKNINGLPIDHSTSEFTICLLLEWEK